VTDQPLPPRVHRTLSASTDVAGIIGDYFAAVTARDVARLRGLFALDATLKSGDVRLVGRDAIVGYYVDNTFTFDDFRPEPGPLRVDGTRVSVDLTVHLGGADYLVRDVFETDGTHITALYISGFEDALRGARSPHR
jgi:hypothetical protein